MLGECNYSIAIGGNNGSIEAGTFVSPLECGCGRGSSGMQRGLNVEGAGLFLFVTPPSILLSSRGDMVRDRGNGCAIGEYRGCCIGSGPVCMETILYTCERRAESSFRSG